LKKSMLKKEEL